MGATVVISYSSLKNASSEAKQVATKLNTYANNLSNVVYNKLSRYDGNHTQNIATAKAKTNAKIDMLRKKSQAYRNYATDLVELRDKCESIDKTVKTKISKLTATFKSNHGIRNSKVENTINYYLIGLKNSSPAGRWLSNKKDQYNSVKDYLKQKMEDWWDYEGGKELIKGLALGILEVVAGIAGIVAAIGAILTAGTLLAAIAGVASLIASAIGVVNGLVSINEEAAAYNTTKNGDPATGRRRSKIDSLTDYLRSSFVYGDDGENYQYNPTLNKIAAGIDAVNLVCSAISFVSDVKNFIDSAKNMIKNAYKWTTGSFADVKNLRMKNILTKDNLLQFGNKVKTTIKNGIGDISTAFRSGNFQKIKEFAFDFGDDFVNNLKKGYTFEIFAEDSKVSSYIQHGSKLVKNYTSITKTLIKKGPSAVVSDLVTKNLNVAEVVTYNPDKVGVFAYDISKIKFNDIKDFVKEPTELVKKPTEFFNDGLEILHKFNDKSSVSVKIPDIAIPKFSTLRNFKIA